jgi:hypothetical protein
MSINRRIEELERQVAAAFIRAMMDPQTEA